MAAAGRERDDDDGTTGLTEDRDVAMIDGGECVDRDDDDDRDTTGEAEGEEKCTWI